MVRAAAALRPRPAPVGRHRPGRRAAADRDLRPAAGRVLGLPVPAPAAHADPAVAERRVDPAHPAARPERRRRGRPRDHGVRPVRRRRQLRRGHRRVPGADRHPVRGHQPRRGPHLGGHGAIHPRRDARQADGDRRRPERRRSSTRSEARERRERVRREADFYGAMDGAIRFTQRDALAAAAHHRRQHRRRPDHRRRAARPRHRRRPRRPTRS